MRWLGGLWLGFTSLACLAEVDGGGRDLSIALFSAQPPVSVVVTAAGPGAWWADCLSCPHQPLTGSLRMPGLLEVVAGGPLTVRDEQGAQERTANGKWHLLTTSGHGVEVVLTIPSERYVAAVLKGEATSDEPRESLRAMAVVARTLALRAVATRPPPGHLASDVCDSTACQAIKLGQVSDDMAEAVRSTAGETLWFRSQRAEVFFSGSCGGVTESGAAVWPKLKGLPYLRSSPDPYCVRKDRAGWHAEVPLASLQSIAVREGWRLPRRIVVARVTDRTVSQRARLIGFEGEGGQAETVSASTLRFAIGRSLGWNLVRSDAYDLRVRDGLLVFDGHGHGHGVGLCQQGATEMAHERKSSREILTFYFPGTAVRITHSDEGWRQSARDGLSITSASPFTSELLDQAVAAWRIAKERFPVRRGVSPAVVFAPTTEVFRQVTSQPGWQLASTSGTSIVLQPLAVMAANRTTLASTLQHEMLHVAVEASAHPKAPLWLREGLVEVLAGDAERTVPQLSAEQTEKLLQGAVSRQQSQAAHRDAGARTRLLVERYGMSAVRSWLMYGGVVPAS